MPFATLCRRVGRVASTAAGLSLIACGAGAPTESPPRYSLDGTYEAAAIGSGTRFSSLTFVAGSNEFWGVKANCTVGCTIQGKFTLEDGGTNLRLTHDGLTESLAFAADPTRAKAIKPAASSQALRAANIKIDTSLNLQCGTVLPAPTTAPKKTPSPPSASEDQSVNSGAAGDSLITATGEKLITEGVSLLATAFDVADDTANSETTPASLRPLGAGASNASTTMLLAAETGTCASPIKQVDGAAKCAGARFVGSGTEGESCSTLCAKHVDKSGCASAALDATSKVARIDSNPGTRCGRMVAGCYCCASAKLLGTTDDE